MTGGRECEAGARLWRGKWAAVLLASGSEARAFCLGTGRAGRVTWMRRSPRARAWGSAGRAHTFISLL
jgi:hypothetical protein